MLAGPLAGLAVSSPIFVAFEAERTHEGVRLIVWKKAASDLFGSDRPVPSQSPEFVQPLPA
jgi:hypothetical protein